MDSLRASSSSLSRECVETSLSHEEGFQEGCANKIIINELRGSKESNFRLRYQVSIEKAVSTDTPSIYEQCGLVEVVFKERAVLGKQKNIVLLISEEKREQLIHTLTGPNSLQFLRTLGHNYWDKKSFSIDEISFFPVPGEFSSWLEKTDKDLQGGLEESAFYLRVNFHMFTKAAESLSLKLKEHISQVFSAFFCSLEKEEQEVWLRNLLPNFNLAINRYCSEPEDEVLLELIADVVSLETLPIDILYQVARLSLREGNTKVLRQILEKNLLGKKEQQKLVCSLQECIVARNRPEKAKQVEAAVGLVLESINVEGVSLNTLVLKNLVFERMGASIDKAIGGSLEKTFAKESALIGLTEIFLEKGVKVEPHCSVVMHWGLSNEVNTLEFLFSLEGPIEEKSRAVGLSLIEKGLLTPEKSFMRIIRSDPEKYKWIFPSLIKVGILSESEVDRIWQKNRPLDLTDTNSVLSYLEDAAVTLEEALEKGNICAERADLKSIIKVRELIRKTQIESPDEKVVEKYAEVVSLFEKVTEKHPILQLFEQVEKEMEENKQGHLLVTLVGQWFPLSGHTMQGAKDIALELNPDSSQWYFIQKEIIKCYRKYPDLPRIRWVHGTKSGSFIQILKVKKLLSTGAILANGDVPFGGELCGSHQKGAINFGAISGKKPSKYWNTRKKVRDAYLDAATNFSVNKLYAQRQRTYHQNMMMDIQGWQETLESALESDLIGANLFYLHVVVERLKRVGKVDEDLFSALRDKLIREQKKVEGYQGYKELFSSLINPFNAPYLISEVEIALGEQNFPILFGSQDPLPFTKAQEGMETTVPSGLELGREITTVFTEKEHMDKVTELLAENGIKGISVYPLEAVFLAEMRNIMENEELEAINAPKQLEEGQSCSALVGDVLQKVILPYYGKPLFKEPNYRRSNGMREKVPQPFYGKMGNYERYQEHVEKGGLPREIHGSMHAVRTAIWSQVVAKFMAGQEGRETPSARDLFLTQIAAGCHDMARQDEGEDRWDPESADRGAKIVRRMGFSKGEKASVYDALACKDEKGGEVPELRKRVHDADCLEIVRVLFDWKEFQKDRLYFYRQAVDKTQAEELVHEIQSVIRVTEDSEVKRYLESHSSNYYRDVLAIIHRLAQSEHMPILQELLENSFQEMGIEEYRLDEKLERLFMENTVRDMV